jgi:hypothetical protein
LSYKPFKQESFNEFNDKVMRIVKKNLLFHGYYLEENPDKFGVDFLLLNTYCQVRGFVEIESHAKHWFEHFPFETVHFLGRKLKYVKPNSYYIMINYNGVSSVMLPFEELKKYDVIRMDTAVFKEDAIIDVPIDKCVWGWGNISKFIENDLKKNFIVFINKKI